MAGELDLTTMLRTMEPTVRPGEYVVVSTPEPLAGLAVHASIVEDEGVTSVVRREDAEAHGLSYEFVAGWITLQVHSALEAVGLTAAFATAMAEAGLSCNVLAGAFHDHLLVPYERTDEAVGVLRDLSARS